MIRMRLPWAEFGGGAGAQQSATKARYTGGIGRDGRVRTPAMWRVKFPPLPFRLISSASGSLHRRNIEGKSGGSLTTNCPLSSRVADNMRLAAIEANEPGVQGGCRLPRGILCRTADSVELSSWFEKPKSNH